jgi:serine/threonine protein kinase
MHSNISPELKDLVLRMLEKKPSRRISIPEIWHHPWISKYKEFRRKALIVDRFSTQSSDSVVAPIIQLNQEPILEEDEDKIVIDTNHLGLGTDLNE